MRLREAIIAAVSLACQLPVFGRPGAMVPLTVLGQQADVVAVGTVGRITAEPDHLEARLELRIGHVLRGHPGTLTLDAIVVPSEPGVRAGQFVPAGLVGKRGLWFLALRPDGYHIMPLVSGAYTSDELYIPVAESVEIDAQTGTLNQRLLGYLVAWYQSVPEPTFRNDMTLLSNLQSVNAADCLEASATLIRSRWLAHRAAGLAAAIRCGSDDGIAALVQDLTALSGDARFPLITDALRDFYRPNGDASIRALSALIRLHTDVPGVDAAAGAALSKLRTKMVLPLMAELLDSKDPEAQLRAAAYFGLYTLFADQHGNFPDSGPVGPFSTEETKLFKPRRGSTITPAEYARFWKQWWADHRTELGF